VPSSGTGVTPSATDTLLAQSYDTVGDFPDNEGTVHYVSHGGATITGASQSKNAVAVVDGDYRIVYFRAQSRRSTKDSAADLQSALNNAMYVLRMPNKAFADNAISVLIAGEFTVGYDIENPHTTLPAMLQYDLYTGMVIITLTTTFQNLTPAYGNVAAGFLMDFSIPDLLVRVVSGAYFLYQFMAEALGAVNYGLNYGVVIAKALAPLLAVSSTNTFIVPYSTDAPDVRPLNGIEVTQEVFNTFIALSKAKASSSATRKLTFPVVSTIS
jgi:hypothetical protein